MRNIISSIQLIIIASLLLLSNNSLAQSCVCALCNVPCSSPASAHTNPLCPVYKNRIANTGSKSASPGLNMEQQIMGSVFQSLIRSVFSTSNTKSPSPEEKQKLEREQQERMKQLAMRQAILKRYNDSIAQAKHDKMMKDYKTLDGSGNLS
jgi:hypothetical protein